MAMKTCKRIVFVQLYLWNHDKGECSTGTNPTTDSTTLGQLAESGIRAILGGKIKSWLNLHSRK